jgi:hypothetical protein
MPRSVFAGAAAVLSVLLPWVSALGQAHTVTASADTYITEHPSLGGPGSTHGSDPALYEIGSTSCSEGDCVAFPLVQFDLSGFAGQTVVGTASLTFNVVATWNSSTVSQSIEAFQVLVPWNQSTVSWNSFGPGPICGTNVVCTSLSTVSVTVNPGSTVTFSNLPASLLQQWINNPASNYGLLLQSTTLGTDQDIAFASTRNTAAAGPKLSFQTTAPCTLKDTAKYSVTSSTLTMKFTLGNTSAATWNAWLTDQNTATQLFSISQPITNPAVVITKTASLPKEGKVGVLSTLTTTTQGIICSSWVQVATGTP